MAEPGLWGLRSAVKVRGFERTACVHFEVQKNGSRFQRTQLRRTKSMANKTLPPSPKIFPKPPNFRHDHNHKI